MTHFYFAYGMNTNLDSMRWRCPDALALGAARLLAHRFRFALHADVQRDRRSSVDGVLWQITDQCLANLDQLEGYPHYYDRSVRRVEHRGEHYDALVYHMQPGNRDARPTAGYLDMIIEGYEQFGVPLRQVWQHLDYHG